MECRVGGRGGKDEISAQTAVALAAAPEVLVAQSAPCFALSTNTPTIASAPAPAPAPTPLKIPAPVMPSSNKTTTASTAPGQTPALR